MLDERTQEIVKLFKSSWIETKNRFEELLYKYNFQPQYIQPYIDFINKMIDEGQDEFFRAGTFMHDLGISRSVDTRLRSDQKYIKIEAFDDGFRIVFRDGEKEYRNYKIENLQNQKFINLISTLKSTLVD